jgi:hypothetical protein
MAFTFLRSYQPDTEHPEEEEDEMPMARSGSVRAFSHLPDSTENAGGVGGHQAPGPAAAPQARSQGEAPDSGFVFHPPEQGDDHDADSGTMDHPSDGRSIDSGFAAQVPADWGNRTRDSGFAAQAPAEWGSRARGPASAAGPPPTAGSGGMTGLPKSLLFEKRLPPGFRATGSGQPRSLTDQAVPQDRAQYSPATADSRPQEDAQPVADARSATPQPQGVALHHRL